jgi:glyoxylase-like metal-dependent hydrolase (beta-lactamase superfamily II)
MAEDIPYNRVFDLEPGRTEEVAPGVRRIVANNPGPFTFKGTVSYIVGRGNAAIIDPGPDDPAHIAALLDAVRGETVTHIFVTHTHRDHSPGVPAIKAATGAQVLAEGPHRASRPLHAGEAPRMEAANDTDFRPDRALADGEVVTGNGWTDFHKSFGEGQAHLRGATPCVGSPRDSMLDRAARHCAGRTACVSFW